MKYIVETISLHRHVHVVVAESEEKALSIANEADDNWQEYLGQVKVDISEFNEDQIKHFRDKQYFWDGVAFRDENGGIDYLRPNVGF